MTIKEKQMDIKLTLSIEEVNGVIAVLATLPFGQVHELLNKIRSQALEQVKEAQAAEVPADAPVEALEPELAE
jgi:hypothetical protein